MKKLLSIVVPVYNEEKNINNFYEEITKCFKKITNYKLEIIFVSDYSSDLTFDVIRKLHKKDKNVKYIFMANKYGKEPSMYAGLKKAKGDLVMLMDVDMQDPPSLIPEMIKYIESGEYDVVATRRKNRKGEPPIRSLFSYMFYKLINKTSNLNMLSGARDFRLMKREVVDLVLLSKEKNRFLKAIYSYTGFRTKWIEYENIERKHGKTKWSFIGLYRYAMTCIYGFSNLPLLIIKYLGILLSVSAFIMFILFFIFKLGKVYLLINFMTLFTGLIILVMSILGEYLYNIFIEVKDKPLYIIFEESD